MAHSADNPHTKTHRHNGKQQQLQRIAGLKKEKLHRNKQQQAGETPASLSDIEKCEHAKAQWQKKRQLPCHIGKQQKNGCHTDTQPVLWIPAVTA